MEPEIKFMQKLTLLLGVISSGLAVVIGAFGSHLLKATLEASQRTATFETAVKYQFYHSLALLILGLMMYKVSHKFLTYAAWSHLTGILIFSGSLYILCLTNNPKWGAVTPLGGLAFITGWIFALIALQKSL